MTRVAISGGFDPIHAGHISLFKEAAKLGAHLMVFLNSDEWLIRKKGYYLFSWEERRDILLNIKQIDSVVAVDDRDGSVNSALRIYSPDIFVNGGDRTPDNIPEIAVCKALRIETLFNIGGPKTNSSSVAMKRGNRDRSWGKYELLYQGPTDDGYLKVKILTLEPGQGTSTQKHKHRTEFFLRLHGETELVKHMKDIGFVIPPGTIHSVPRGIWHRLVNRGGTTATVLELQWGGVVEEDDIERHPGD